MDRLSVIRGVRALIVPAVVGLSVAGCPKVPQQTGLMAQMNITASATELRARMGEFGRRFAAYLEVSADSVIEATSDPSIQRSAILYKLSAIPAAHDAALRSDPLLAGWDMWAFLLQLRQFASSEDGTRVFGEYNDIVVRGIDEATAKFDELADAVTGGERDSAGVARVQAWVDDHPIENVPFVRPSIIGEAAGLLGGGGGLGSMVVGLEGSLSRLEQRVAYLSETAFKQAVWVGQIAVRNGMALDEVTRFFDLMDASTSFLEEFPSMLTEHRVAVIDAIGRERYTVMLELERLRGETIAELSRERVAILDALAAERAIVMDGFAGERAAVMAGVDSLANQVIDRQYKLVDHIFWRLLQLAAVLGVLALVGVWAVVRLVRR